MANGNYNTRKRASAQSGVITLLLFIGIIVIAWLVIWPAYKNIGEAQDRSSAAETQHEAKLQTTKNLDKLLDNYNRNKSKIKPLDQALPDSPEVPQLLYNVESLVIQSGMAIDSFKITEKLDDLTKSVGQSSGAKNLATSTSDTFVTKRKLVILDIDLVVTGSYETFPMLLDLLQKNLRLFDIRSINIGQETGNSAGPATAGGTDSSQFTLKIETYYLQ